MELKELLFFRTQEEYRAYYRMITSREYQEEELEIQKHRFMAVFQIIEEAELKEEYREWKKKNIPELQD